jgi:hypothetical protein
MSVIFDQYEERLHRLNRHPHTILGFKRAVKPFEDYLKAHRLAPEQWTRTRWRSS